MKEAVIELDNVFKIYHIGEIAVPALRGLSLKIYPGEFVAIMGPSGSGKSTSMNMIGCLDVPTTGKILLEGTNIADLQESELAQIRGGKIGFIFQQFNLINTLSALENVMLPMMFQETTKDERIERAQKLLTRVGLGDRVLHKPTELSGGQQQRVAIARSMANDPSVILADEPTGNLDSKTGLNVIDFLKRLNKDEKKTVVMVTHDSDIAAHAKRVVHLIDGKIVKGGKIK